MSPHRSEWIIIGISGVTCGGKTTLSNKLIESVANSRVLHQDKYFLPDDHPSHVLVPDLEPAHNNYDILTALDMKQMYSDALAIIEGAEIAHGSSPPPTPGMWRAGGAGGAGGVGGAGRTGAGGGRKLLILEGFTALNYRPIYELCDLRYYFTLEYGECFSRRALRLYEPADVAGYFERCVWPEHLRYRAELENDPNVKILDGTLDRTEVYNTVIRDLRRLGAEAITE